MVIFCFLSIPSIHKEKSYIYKPTIVNAQDKKESKEIISKEGTDNTQEIYKRYKDNSFTLMNKGYEGLNPVTLFIQNLLLGVKNFFFALTVFVGKFNMFLVDTLFSIDIATTISKPIQQLSMVLSKNLTNVASSIGLITFSVFMMNKFFLTGKLTEVLKILGLAIATFTVLAMFNAPKTNNMIFTGVIEVDNQIENAFAGLNPKFSDADSANETSNIGKKLSADILRTNIYEPYLFLSYGTSDVNKIRKETIEYDGGKYDRIGILLDNDNGTEEQIKMIEAVTDIEVDDLKNNAPTYKNAGIQIFYSLAYTVTNFIQTIIFGILGILRLALQFLLVLMPFLLPILLIIGIMLHGTPLLSNFFKGFLGVSFLKAGLSLATVVFTSYVSLAYSMDLGDANVLTIIITRLAWILAPIGMYFFRYFIGGLFSQNVRMMGGGLMYSALHPAKANVLAQRNREKQKEDRANARKKAQLEREKKKKENPEKKDDLNKINPRDKKLSELRNRQQNEQQNTDNKNNDLNKTNQAADNTERQTKSATNEENTDFSTLNNQAKTTPENINQRSPKSSEQQNTENQRQQRLEQYQAQQEKEHDKPNNLQAKKTTTKTNNRQAARTDLDCTKSNEFNSNNPINSKKIPLGTRNDRVSCSGDTTLVKEKVVKGGKNVTFPTKQQINQPTQLKQNAKTKQQINTKKNVRFTIPKNKRRD